MQNISFHSSFTTIILAALTVAAFSMPAAAMDRPLNEEAVGMEHHAAYLRKTLAEHKLHPCHFCLSSEEETENVKIFDIKKHQEQRTLEIHGCHPKKEAFEHVHPTPLLQTPSAYFSLWSYVSSMSMPSFMPRLWPFLWSTPTLETTPTFEMLIKSETDHSYTLLETSLLSSSQATPNSEAIAVLETLIKSECVQSSPLTVSSFYLIPIDENYGRRPSETDPVELGLSLNGGGGRGYMEALWLQHLAKEANAPIWRIFDSIAGVSIGGIIGAGAACDKMREADLVEFFTTEFKQVFPTTPSWNIPVRLWDSASAIFYPQYDANPLEMLLRQKIGALKLNETLTDVIISAVNTKNNELCAFNRSQYGDLPVWQVARASSAAPTFFKAYEINGLHYIDGGIGENNPVLRLLMRMRELSQERNQSFSLDKIKVLSLGTGDMPVNSIPNEAGLSSAERIISACIDVQSNAANMTAKSLLGENFIRCNPKLSKAIPLNILGTEELEILEAAAETQYTIIEEFAHSDVVRRRLERFQ
ncbi:MAG: patatin-like phospholipase family protein [Candidatus Paracaedibacter sp.]